MNRYSDFTAELSGNPRPQSPRGKNPAQQWLLLGICEPLRGKLQNRRKSHLGVIAVFNPEVIFYNAHFTKRLPHPRSSWLICIRQAEDCKPDKPEFPNRQDFQ